MQRATHDGHVLFANLKEGVRHCLACKVALVSATLLTIRSGSDALQARSLNTSHASAC